jgi:hypothetical protein
MKIFLFLCEEVQTEPAYFEYLKHKRTLALGYKPALKKRPPNIFGGTPKR